MTLKLKTPPMPEQAYWGLEMYGSIVSGANNAERANGMSPGCTTKLFTEAQLAARDAQWLELVGPVVEALPNLHSVIVWLRAGCSKEDAIKELEIYRDRINSALRAITEEQE